MKRIFLLLVLLLVWPTFTLSAPIGASVAESDGDPSGWAYKFVFTNGSLSLLNGVATVTLTGGLTPGTTGGAIFEAETSAAVKALLSYLTDFVDETVPILGGNLQLSTFGIVGTPVTFAASDATPDVSEGTFFQTANTVATTITDFDGTVAWRPFIVEINDTFTTVNFATAPISGHGEVALVAPPVGTLLFCVDNGTTINCMVSNWTSMALSVFISPMGTTPAQTANGSRYWDSDDFEDTVGNGTTRETFIPTGTHTDEMACSYEATGNNIDCDGSLGATSFTGAITTTSTIAGVTGMTMGSATVDTGIFTMIKGAQASDPQTTLTMSADGVGGLTLATANGSNGDITITPSGGDTIFTTDITVSGGDIKTGNIPLVIGDATTDSITLSGESETLVITPSADLVTVSTGTGVASIGFSAINLLTTGTITGGISTDKDDNALSADQLYGQAHWYSGVAETVTLAAAVVGMNTLIYGSAAVIVNIDPNGTDTIVLSGTALAAGYQIESPATAGSYVGLVCFTANQWTTMGMGNTWVTHGAD